MPPDLEHAWLRQMETFMRQVEAVDRARETRGYERAWCRFYGRMILAPAPDAGIPGRKRKLRAEARRRFQAEIDALYRSDLPDDELYGAEPRPCSNCGAPSHPGKFCLRRNNGTNEQGGIGNG